MNCKTMKEKWTELLEDIKRFFLITVVAVLGTAIFAFILAFGMISRENRELKEQIKYMEMKEDSKKEDRKENTKYIVVMDEITGEVVYAYYK